LPDTPVAWPTGETDRIIAALPGATESPLTADSSVAPAKSPPPRPPVQIIPALPPGVASRPKIDEMLICSAQGEVLYEWQCPDKELWVNFFEFISQRGQRLAQSLPLGEFDRLEVESGGARAVVIISHERGVLVKSRREPISR
ncbi:MAG: hypothetical protein U1F83_13600, partial [Verrucomicrobiota bacterium]